MKNFLVSLLCFFSLSYAFSQSGNPPYKQNPNLPSFQLQLPNNTSFSSANLKKNTPTIIMFFSPGCDHCIQQFGDMTKRMADLRKYQIVMATIQPVEELAAFHKKYQLSKYPNIITGTDVNYFFPPFYEIRNFPYFAFYDKTGRLTGTYEGNMSVDNILKKLK